MGSEQSVLAKAVENNDTSPLVPYFEAQRLAWEAMDSGEDFEQIQSLLLKILLGISLVFGLFFLALMWWEDTHPKLPPHLQKSNDEDQGEDYEIPSIF